MLLLLLRFSFSFFSSHASTAYAMFDVCRLQKSVSWAGRLTAVEQERAPRGREEGGGRKARGDTSFLSSSSLSLSRFFLHLLS